jgi:hypothetical protein
MTPININTLFADIIDTPEQRQEKLLQQGMTQGRLLSSNLTGLARAAAPLAQMAGQLGVQRNEDLRRAVQPMLGLDPRTDSEKMQEKIGQMDFTTPQGLIDAANALQSTDPVRAASLRQAAVALDKETKAQKRTISRQDAADARAEAQAEYAAEAAARAKRSEVKSDTQFEWQTEDQKRSREQFDNSITDFNNRQADRLRDETARENEITSSNLLKASLVEQMIATDPENNYIELLSNEDAFIPLNELRLIENQFKQGMDKDIGVYTVFDQSTGRNMIMTFDKKTGDKLNVIGQSARTATNRDRDVPNLSTTREKTIKDALRNEDLFKKYLIFDLTTGDESTGENALTDMIHNYAERNNESYTLSIASLRNELQKIDDAPRLEREGLTKILSTILSAGLLPSEIAKDTNQSGAATNNQPELSDEEKFIRDMEEKGMTITPVPESQ